MSICQLGVDLTPTSKMFVHLEHDQPYKPALELRDDRFMAAACSQSVDPAPSLPVWCRQRRCVFIRRGGLLRAHGLHSAGRLLARSRLSRLELPGCTANCSLPCLQCICCLLLSVAHTPEPSVDCLDQGSGKDLIQPVLDNQLKASSPLIIPEEVPPKPGLLFICIAFLSASLS